MRKVSPMLAVLVLAACSPEIPDSAAGVGFDSYDSYSAQREQALAAEMTVRPLEDSPQDQAGVSAQAAAGSVPLTALDVQAIAPVDVNNPAISDEQSFSAVSARESIESDRARLEAQREQYTFVSPEPLPERVGDSGPNIVQYALGADNALGEARFRRLGVGSQMRMLRNCARYASSDLAQQAFLAAGGPQRDKLGLDPDGDGFACYWDPTPFRAAVN